MMMENVRVMKKPAEVCPLCEGTGWKSVSTAADRRVKQVIICTPDKDLGQCVGGKVVQLDRRQNKWIDSAGVVEKFGVPAESIPDWLALVGDSADRQDSIRTIAGFGYRWLTDA